MVGAAAENSATGEDGPKSVGLVGVGRMGLPIARHMLAAGFGVIVFDLNAGSVAEAEAAGCRVAESLPALARASDVVLVLVPTDGDVTTVCSADKGLLAGAGSGTVIALCSSLLPETVMRVADEASALGVRVLDVPLTKGARAARSGTLTLLVGGDEAALEEVRPVLETFSTAIHLVGPVGAGQVVKTINNILLWTNLAALVEALELGARLGVDADRLREVLMDCSADSWVLRALPTIEPTWPGKDMDNALKMAGGAGLALPLANTVRQRMTGFSRGDIDKVLGG